MAKQRSDHGFARLSSSFGCVVAKVNQERPESSSFPELKSAWAQHYRGAFAEFDARLQAEADEGRARALDLISVSISHHNLERLLEALENEIEARPLETTRIPERISDLVEVCGRLQRLLDDAAAKFDGTISV